MTDDSPARSDQALAAAGVADAPAMEELYRRYVERIYRYCLIRLGDPAKAEDAASETFARMLKSLPSYQGGLFAAWLFRIAQHAVADSQRLERPSLPLDAAAERAGRERVDEERVFLEQLLRVLPEEQRTAVETFAAGWPDEQIAAALGKSPGAVRVLRFRAVRKLREMLGEDTEAERRP